MRGILSTKREIKCLAVATLVLSVLASALHIAGFVTPGWTVIKVLAVDNSEVLFDISYHSSLWYITVCSQTKCVIKAIWDVSSNNDPLNWIYYTISDGITAYQTETSVALILSVIAIGLLVVNFRSQRSDFTSLCLLITAMTCHVIAGVAALVASGSKAQNTVKWKDIYNLQFPFSVLLIGLAGLLNITSVLLSIKPLIYILQIMKRPSSQRQSLMTSSLPPSLTGTSTPQFSRPQKVEQPKPTKVPKSSKYQTGTLKDWQNTEQRVELPQTQNGLKSEQRTRRHRNDPHYKRDHNSSSPEANFDSEPPYNGRSYNEARYNESSYGERSYTQSRYNPPSYNDIANNERSFEPPNGGASGSVRPPNYWELMESQNHAYDNQAADPMESCV